MKMITLLVPENYIIDLDYLVRERFYPHRAETIRVAIRDLLTAHDLFCIEAFTEIGAVDTGDVT